MSNNKRKTVLYLSYDGMTDNLGQSQVIPYLIGLSKTFDIHIISAEKKDIFPNKKQSIQNILSDNNISWHPVFYTKKPQVISTLIDIIKIRKKAKALNKKFNFSIVHCRSYITAFIGLYLKKRYGIKFIFDMRGFYADERLDGKIWNIKNPVFKIVYNFFKKKEKEFLIFSDYTVSLTENAKNEIFSWTELKNKKLSIEVIPCCADTELFSIKNIDFELQSNLKKTFNISENDFVISYLGSTGTWYLLDEMMSFFKVLIDNKPNSKFLFITSDNSNTIYESAKKNLVESDKIIVIHAERNDVPTFLSLSSISIFFIKAVYSKMASSPTKLAEILSMGIPIISNSGVGDIDLIFNQNKIGVLTKGFENKDFENTIKKIGWVLKIESNYLIKTSNNLFSLQSGIEKYNSIYLKLSAE